MWKKWRNPEEWDGIFYQPGEMETLLATLGQDAEKIWHHTFYNELRVMPEVHPVLLIETSTTLETIREPAPLPSSV